MEDFEKEVQRKNTEAQKARDEKNKQIANLSSGDAIQRAVVEAAKANIKHRAIHEPKVEVKNMPEDLPTRKNLAEVVDSINSLNLTQFNSSQSTISALTDKLGTLVNNLESLNRGQSKGLEPLAKSLADVVKRLSELPKELGGVVLQGNDDSKQIEAINQVKSAIEGQKLDPKITVPAAQVTVNEKEVNLEPVETALKAIQKTLMAQKGIDLSPLLEAVNETTSTISNLRFPVPNFLLPFKDVNGKDTQVQLDASGNIPVTGGGGGSSGIQYAELITTAPGTGTLSLGRYKSSAPTLTDGQMYALQVDASGNLRVAGTFSATPATDIAPATQNITVVDSGSSSAVGANNQTIIIGTPTAGSAASFSLATIETIRVEVTGIWTGTIATETSVDGGTTWVSQGVHQGAYTTSSFTAGFVGGANVAGATNFRVRATAAITGTAVIKVTESVNTQSVYIANAAPSGNVVSILNSSTATLTSGSTYTGTAEDVSNFSEMRISVKSNVASGTDGLSIQQSPDGTNWDITDVYTIAASTGSTFTVPRQARWFRVVYTNGGTNQASFRLQSILNRTATAPSSQRPADGQTNETDLEQQQSFLMGYNGTTWDRIRTVGTGVLSTSAVLTAGSAIVGKVGIDQTTPGTTNLVALAANQSVNLAQVAGSNTQTGSGTASGAQRVELANNGTGVIATVGAVTAITNALPTGTNSIGKISDITTSVVPGTAATNLGKAEDAAHASGDTGVFALGVRNDNLATTYGADQDYSPLATDLKGRVMVAQKAATGTLTNVGASATSVTVLAASSARIGATITNDSSALLYLKFGATASTTSYTVVLAGAASAPFSYYEVPAGYTGIIDGIWASATGNARVTEIT